MTVRRRPDGAPPQVLILRALGLGDFLTGVPAYRALHRAFPGHHLVLAAPTTLADLARLTSAVDELLATPGLVPLHWYRPPPTVAVNLHGRGPQSHSLLDAVGPARRIGFRAPGWDGPGWRDDEHEVDRWCRLLAYHGVDTDPTDLRLPAPGGGPPVPRAAVVIHPGAAYGSRRWPAERFATVARELTCAGHPVVITGGAAERGRADQVAVAAGLPLGAVLAGQTSACELAAVVAGASLVICGDTGIGHLATAFGTPSVVLFGPVSPRWWGPRVGGPHRVLWHPQQLRGDRWAPTPEPALLAITVDEVLDAAHDLLEPTPARAGSAVVTSGPAGSRRRFARRGLQVTGLAATTRGLRNLPASSTRR